MTDRWHLEPGKTADCDPGAVGLEYGLDERASYGHVVGRAPSWSRNR